MSYITKQYIIDSVGKYVYIGTKETSMFQGFYGGILLSFTNQTLTLDSNISVKFNDIKTFSVEEIN